MKCLFCFNENNTAKIYFDRKGRPYFFCSLCSHRIFFRSPIALKSVLCWSETAKALSQQEFITLLQKVENTPVYRNENVQKWIASVNHDSEVVFKDKKE